ncbi:response regulator [Clostridium sp. D43t1_170807_H7]|uniref:response regulator n=1 Tax=unclassified Clostridium TaxID=2614128 RepID=UPI00189A2716|nr:response regulator [Clostridium sp. D43t1_170807_H7]
MNVLIVEDDPMVALINKRYLEKITGVKTFGPVMYEKEIISSLKKNNIDLILMDVFLPEKSGIDILKSLREKNIFIDAIMITAANSTDEIKKAFAYGVVDYLVKPFEFERFKEAINKYRVKNKLLLNDEVLTQKDIDTLLMNSSLESQVKLPKGLNEKTLDRVIKFLNENSNEVWTLREIAYEIKISNVTIKKYMDYLESIGKVNSEMTFGNVGRPEYKYFVKK